MNIAGCNYNRKNVAALLKYHYQDLDSKELSQQLKHGKHFEINSELILEREPNNQYDKNAVRVFAQTEKAIFPLGYIPKKYAEEISNIIIDNPDDITLTLNKIHMFKPKGQDKHMFVVECDIDIED